MNIIYDVSSEIERIGQSIRRFGSKPEHNVHHYMNNEPKNGKNIVFDFGDDRKILANHNEKMDVWSLFPSGVFAPEDESIGLLREFCSYCLEKKGCEKILMELEESIFHKFNSALKLDDSGKLKISSINHTYHWPIIDLKKWDCDLRGKDWHRIRNIIKNARRKNNLSIKACSKISGDLLKNVVYEWKSSRKGTDKTDYLQYTNFIDNGFEGIDYAFSILANGEPCSISAGWKIPNTNSFYLSIILHNYRINGMGELMYIQSLNDLKNMRFDAINLGGSENSLLSFKEKFKPHQMHKTYEFTVKNGNN